MQINRRGSYVVEFVLLLPVFLVLTIGTIDFGRAIYAYTTVAYAARQGTRYASVRGASSISPASASAVAAYVKDQVVGVDISVTTTWNPDNSRGSSVQVVVTTTFTPITPYINRSPINLSATSASVIIS